MVAVIPARVLGGQGHVAGGVRCRGGVVGWSVLTMKNESKKRRATLNLVISGVSLLGIVSSVLWLWLLNDPHAFAGAAFFGVLPVYRYVLLKDVDGVFPE